LNVTVKAGDAGTQERPPAGEEGMKRGDSAVQAVWVSGKCPHIEADGGLLGVETGGAIEQHAIRQR
jgi:hypothetical protein